MQEQVLDETDELSMRQIEENDETINFVTNNNSVTSFKSLSPSKSFENNNMLDKMKPKNNRVGFNLSLFDSGSSIENSSIISPSVFINTNNNNNNNGSYKDYGNGIYDSSSATSTQLENTAFKTALTNETSYNSINIENKNTKANLIKKTLTKVNNDSRKKWFDILSADDEQNDSTSIESIYERALEQQLSFKSLEASTNSNNSKMKQVNDDSMFSLASSSNSSISDTSTNKMRVNRKIAAKVVTKKDIEQTTENKLDVAVAQINLLGQQNTKNNKNENNNNQQLSPIECTKELNKLQLNDENKVNSQKLNQPSQVVSAIKKEVIKPKTTTIENEMSNFEKDLNILKSSEIVNKKNASQKFLNKEQNKFVSDLFVSLSFIFFCIKKLLLTMFYF